MDQLKTSPSQSLSSVTEEDKKGGKDSELGIKERRSPFTETLRDKVTSTQ